MPVFGFSDLGFIYDLRCTVTTLLATCTFDEEPPCPSHYRGEQYDSDLGLYYLRARYYNPATGRFLSRDPEDGKAYDPQSLHKYLYAGGDPVNRADPRGRADASDYTSILANESWKTKLELRASAYAVRVFLCVAEVLSIIYGPDVPEFGRENILEECMEQEL